MGGLIKSVGSFLSNLFGGAPDVPAAPAAPPPPPPPTPMPQPDEEAVLQAKQRSIAAQMQRSGRAASILTQSPEGDKLG